MSSDEDRFKDAFNLVTGGTRRALDRLRHHFLQPRTGPRPSYFIRGPGTEDHFLELILLELQGLRRMELARRGH